MKIELTIGTILQHRYQLQNLLSQKQGRTTFLALDLQSQNLVIIKLVRLNIEFQWDDFKLFEREAATLQNLDHPAIPKYLDYFDLPDGLALVQTYIEAPSLQTLIQAGRKFTEVEVTELADRLLDILTYLHNLHPPVIHRDIKPSNILLSNRSGNSVGNIYLVDFGSVQTAANTDSGTITIVGSYGYTPPEQFYGRTATGSDLYSLGMTLIYLITGTHPAELVTINGRVKFDRTNLSNKFARWLGKMTEYDVSRRFSSAPSAKTALTSSDSSYGDFLHLQPVGSQIELYRDLDRLDIKLRQVAECDLEKDFTYNSLYNLFILSCFANFIVYFAIFPSSWILLSWSSRICLMLVSPTAIILWNILEGLNTSHTYTGCKILSIDRGSQTLKVGIFSESDRKSHWRKKLVENGKVDLLVYHPSYRFEEFYDAESNSNKSGSVKTDPKLSLYMGKHEYPIAANQLSEAELHWLGRELSDFLDLELQIVYPTPNIPAPVSCTTCAGCGCC
jgi:serine/threonine protein kinase